MVRNMVTSMFIGHNTGIVPLVTALSRTEQKCSISCYCQTGLATGMQTTVWYVNHKPLSLWLWNANCSALQSHITFPCHTTQATKWCNACWNCETGTVGNKISLLTCRTFITTCTSVMSTSHIWYWNCDCWDFRTGHSNARYLNVSYFSTAWYNVMKQVVFKNDSDQKWWYGHYSES